MNFKSICLFILLAAVFSSCTREPIGIFEGEVIKQWTIPVSAKFQNPAPAGRTDGGIFNLQVTADNSIRFDFDLKDVNGDVFTSAHIHAGDPLTNGPILLDLTPRIASPVGSGIVFNVRQSLLDSLMNDSTELYFDVHSSTMPNGLARGQIHDQVVLAADVALSGTNEVPPVTTTAKGVANIRLTANKKLYTKVTVTNLEVNDALMAAHIHRGAAGVNGAILINLATSVADFGVNKRVTLDNTGYTTLLNEPSLYVNAHSVLNPAGKIRGQLR